MSPSTKGPRARPDADTSDATYQSFHDVELFEPTAPLADTLIAIPPGRHSEDDNNDDDEEEDNFGPKPITRHDSGYESSGSSRSKSANSPSDHHHHHHKSKREPECKTLEIRHSTEVTTYHQDTVKRRSFPRGQPIAHNPLQVGMSQHQLPNSYFYFPSPEEVAGHADHEESKSGPLYRQPPQTIQYWLSDKTRRLEYAAIDAASRGLKGWFMKHMVPNCIVPKDSRRLTFDDDSGSVRRYRLELEPEASPAPEVKETKSSGRGLGLGRLFKR
ncbi:hypothetical protein GGR50DRAFT_698352 [Xylaria sp. CBS 124048]|nr:hypothetical protein GGR50DRAFT_698352 [Xylaria sp. CBS 124048]